MINVTVPYLPSLSKYIKYVENIYDNNWLTSNGPLVRELTVRLEDKLAVKNLLLTSSGTMALLIAFRVRNVLNKNVLTTPFSFQATYSALEWQGANVSFCDIQNNSWNLDPKLVEKYITDGHRVDCVVPVHTFGNPCDIEAFNHLKNKYNFDLIYDAAHAITTTHSDGKSILSDGDISCFSLQATKLFHTIEGGGMIFNNRDEMEIAAKMINFGFDNTVAIEPGINGKLSEFHAAMGLAILDDLDKIIENREYQKELYEKELKIDLEFQHVENNFVVSPSYMPIVFNSRDELDKSVKNLAKHNIFPRRYFYPAIHKMPFVEKKAEAKICRLLKLFLIKYCVYLCITIKVQNRLKPFAI
ncbi:DegT/DnrJ/EryC1/StrS family aminotransferase [Pseudoalteromonas xiamenensis]